MRLIFIIVIINIRGITKLLKEAIIILNILIFKYNT